MNDADLIIQNLVQANPLREPTIRSIIERLQLPRGSHGLDAGCGIGLHMLSLPILCSRAEVRNDEHTHP